MGLTTMDLEEESIVPSSQETTEVIQPINRDTIHHICSGQVVVSLAIAVKELVENALDAGATIIDVRLKEYGSELIEVSDNGRGVAKENFQALTLKHYTSKIKEFDDLQTLSTLGFRGEALSSLCALSDLSILTKHRATEHATKITYDRNGRITSEDVGAREQGTTVTLQSLFSTLPVRRKEFMKNLKREFNKMCQLLYAYCLVSKGIKFSCTNTKSGAKNTVVQTEGLKTVKENIINVFGAKQISSLIEVEMVKPEEPILTEYGIKLVEGEPLPFSFECFISSVMHGNGRSTNDRQFFYINSRPCDPTKITKLINGVYKQYNVNQYPFVYLNIISKSCMVDVNVTPDKRQLFLEKEKLLLAIIKASLIEAFKVFPSTFKLQNLDLSQNSTITEFFGKSTSRGIKRSSTEPVLKNRSIMERFQKRSKTERPKITIKSPEISFDSGHQSDDEDVSYHDTSVKKLDTFIKIASDISPSQAPIFEEDSKRIICKEKKKIECVVDVEDPGLIIEDKCKNKNNEKEDSKELGETKNGTNSAKKEDCKQSCETIKCETVSQENKEETITKKHSKENKQNIIKTLKRDLVDEDLEISIDTKVRDLSERKSVTLKTSIDEIKRSLQRKNGPDKSNSEIKVRFRSQINPESNKMAEAELQKQISKDDFAKMTVIGQFNLGFIVTRLDNDLFIIDQHATDEKYNFEQLQSSTVMENQVLVNPRPLELTAGNECLLIENEDIFKKNGFTFKIDPSAPCTKKVSLTSIPLSKNIVFGKDDIDEMLFMLQDSTQTMCRPSRIRAIFASRACRKSVMIGKALSKSDMRRLVDHMGEIEQPWNCPHGRPTMRHLINLDLLDSNP